MSRERDPEYNDEAADEVEQFKDPYLVLVPREIIDIIFSYLDPASTKTVRLVSRYWKHIIESAMFWTWAELKMDKEAMEVMEVMESKAVHLVSSHMNM